MKRLLTILLLVVFTIPAFAQRTDSVTVSRQELDEFFTNVDSLQAQNRLLQQLIQNLRAQILTLELVQAQDSTLIQYRDKQIDLLEQEIKIHEARVLRISNRSWTESKFLWFSIGVGTIFVTSAILRNVDNL